MSENDFILKEWERLAQSDLKAARLLLSGNEKLLSVYHLQQCVEKMRFN